MSSGAHSNSLMTRMSGLFTRARQVRPGQPSTGLGTSMSAAWAKLLGLSVGANLGDGSVAVSERDALAIHSWFACVKTISEDVARHVWYVARPVGHEEYEPLWDHPVTRLLNWRPNREMSAYSFHESQTFNVLQRGNCFAEKERGPMGIVGLWPIPPEWVQQRREEYGERIGELVYDINAEYNSIIGLPADALVHIRGLSDDGLWGINVRALHASTTLGVPYQMTRFLAAFAKNMFRPAIGFEFPANMTDGEQAKALVKHVWEMGSGNNQGKPIPLIGGMKPVPLTMQLDQAQFEAIRGKSPAEVCALFRCPPHKIGDLSRSTNNNIEAQDVQYNTETLGPWRARFEGELTKLVWDEGLVVLADEWELTRGSFSMRTQAAERYIRAGVWSPNEARLKEGYRRVEHPAMDAYQFNANTVLHDQVADVVAARIKKDAGAGSGGGGESAGGGGGGGGQARRRAMVLAFEPAVRASVRRSLMVERDRLTRDARDRSGGEDYIRRGEELLAKLGEGLLEQLAPTVEAMAGVLEVRDGSDAARQMAQAMVTRHQAESKIKLVHQRIKPWNDQELEQEAQRRAGVLVQDVAAKWA
jgi:HK97 family phage portal protein